MWLGEEYYDMIEADASTRQVAEGNLGRIFDTLVARLDEVLSA